MCLQILDGSICKPSDGIILNCFISLLTPVKVVFHGKTLSQIRWSECSTAEGFPFVLARIFIVTCSWE